MKYRVRLDLSFASEADARSLMDSAKSISSQAVSSTLTLLELKGIVRQVGGMNYVMVREPDPAYEVTPPAE